jgi:hypothetical protein
MKASIKGSTLVIEIEVQKPALSASGKSKVVASSRGNVVFPDVLIEGKPLTVGLNAYISAK